jgi:hypothetical protein
LPPLRLLAATVSTAQPVPVLFDTDIGTDIDDAARRCPAQPRTRLLVTPSGDAVAARGSPQLLAIEGGAARVGLRRHVIDAYEAAEWRRSRRRRSRSVAFMRAQIDAAWRVDDHRGGRATNGGAGTSYPIAGKIKRIALMAGPCAGRAARLTAGVAIKSTPRRRACVHVGSAMIVAPSIYRRPRSRRNTASASSHAARRSPTRSPPSTSCGG